MDSAEQKLTKCQVLREGVVSFYFQRNDKKTDIKNKNALKKPQMKSSFKALIKIDAGIGLSSQAVARQVFSLKWVFTTVFGMGTGGFLTLGHQRILLTLCALKGA